MTTDEKIVWLTQHGFTLPDGLIDMHGRHATHRWFQNDGVDACRLTSQQAYDLCAMHFAREACRAGVWSYELSAALCAGDSTAAIDAIYDAMMAREPK